ncbi:MAG: reprolysin-like metallopeptidase [Crocinitomicaceae bacterium]
MKLFYSLVLVILANQLTAQFAFQTYRPSESELNNADIHATKATYYQVNLQSIEASVHNIPYREDADILHSHFTLSIPDLAGNIQTYKILRNQTMHPNLNSLFPQIISFDGVNVNNSAEKAKFDITPQGFHAMIMNPAFSTVFIDPISRSTPNKVMVYAKKDFTTNKVRSCNLETETERIEKLIHSEAPLKTLLGSCELRTYRLALAATVEYTTFQGGTVALAAAAQVTTMNRVNGVYEKDMAITMVIIPNNNLLIYTTTDPYTNGTPNSMITENQTNVTNVIGSANYDIGHVFGTNSGGLAGLGVVCSSSNKARGVTGSAAPVGDPFDIDYVAHEMGHQFKANHTQNNNCNRNNATAIEPGSASTIMGYAGICSPNVQSNSDDHFHGINLGEISNFITAANHTCPVVTALNNLPPVINSTNGNISIPANTPFALTALASDPDMDLLTYNWEQTDNQVSTQPPVASSISGPNFRSNPSSPSPTRYFPNLTSLSTGGPYTWEVVPSVSRTLHFRCTVRDNAMGGGCADYSNVTVSTVATAGPFIVTYPTATGISWVGNSLQTVTWDVANTTAAPISATNVSIYLSIDGGLTYPTLLVANTPNDGTQSITVPNTPSTTARIMVISAAGTFFDISNNNFTITFGSPCNQPVITAVSSDTTVCDGTPAVVSLSGTLNDATTWQWYSGSCGGSTVGTGTSLNVLPSSTTTYYVRGIGGCVTSGPCIPVTVTVTQLNLNVNPVGTTLYSLQPPAGTNYQWLICSNGFSPIVGANNSSFTPTLNLGSYAVEITKDGCIDTSACFTINQTGLENITHSNFTLSPNPTNGSAVLTWDKTLELESVELVDLKGRTISRYEIFENSSVLVSLEDLEAALYILRIHHLNGVENVKLVKK